jgi:hypothetical protein
LVVEAHRPEGEVFPAITQGFRSGEVVLKVSADRDAGFVDAGHLVSPALSFQQGH